MKAFNGKLGIQQRVLPVYRVPFIRQLAELFPSRLGIFAGEARSSEAIAPGKLDDIPVQYTRAQNNHFGFGPFYTCQQNNFLAWLENFQPDALIVEANPRYLSTPAAIRWMHQRGKPVLGWGLGVNPGSGPLEWFRSRRRQSLLDSLDGMIAYSRQGAAQYRASGFPAERVFTAQNAAVLPPARPVQRMPYDQKATILFVGRLQRRKRLDLLFQACAALALDLQPEVIVAGDGPDRAYFESFAEEIYPDAQFVGAKFGQELERYYQQADLFVLPGTGGLAVQQAMAQGLPVIVAEGDGTQSDLVRPENGWMVTPDDLLALRDTLTQALSYPVRLVEMGAESYRIVKDDINLVKMAEAFRDAVSRIANLGLRD